MDLLKKYFDKMTPVFKSTTHLDEVILFGSWAKETSTPGSDIDLALKGDSLTWDDLNILSLKLYDLFIPNKFDLVIYDRINDPDLVSHIDRVGKKVYKREINP